MSHVTTVTQLEALYGEVSLGARAKETDRVTEHYGAFIEASPFMILGTHGPGGLDCSPRGDGPGFIRIADDKTLILPDRRGNNRIDSLRNVLHDPHVAMLFLVPGIGETLRVNGRAVISADANLLEGFAVDGKAPKTALIITVEAVFIQCSRAIVRSDLWNPEKRLPRSALPSTGQMLASLSDNAVDGDAYDKALPERLRETLY